MRKEFDKPAVDLVEALPGGEWAVRWDMKPKLDKDGNETGTYWCEEEILYHIPQMDEIRQMVISWQNRQVDGAILRGCLWNGMQIWLSMENQFNYKSVFDLAVMTEPQLQAWDAEHPDLAGKEYVIHTVTNEYGTTFEIPEPTGRPKAVLPVQFKFGTDEQPQYHTFNTLEELAGFYTYTLSYIQGCYTAGWAKKDNFDYSVYEEAIAAL